MTRREFFAWLAGFLFGAAGFGLAAVATLHDAGVL